MCNPGQVEYTAPKVARKKDRNKNCQATRLSVRVFVGEQSKVLACLTTFNTIGQEPKKSHLVRNVQRGTELVGSFSGPTCSGPTPTLRSKDFIFHNMFSG